MKLRSIKFVAHPGALKAMFATWIAGLAAAALAMFVTGPMAHAALESTLAPAPVIRPSSDLGQTPTEPEVPASAGSRTDTISAVNPLTPKVGRPPWFSAHAVVAPNGFGSPVFAIQGQPGLNARMGQVIASAAVDFQPLHFLGVWGIGPTLDLIFPTSKVQGQSAPLQSAFAVGAEVRYQALFWDRQPLVPTFSYALKYLRYRLDTGLGGLYVQEPALGLWLNLGWLDPEITRSMRRELGIQRAYVMVEYRRFASADFVGAPVGVASLSLSGDLVQTGLRFEF